MHINNMKICKDCWAVFVSNLFSNCKFVDNETYSNLFEKKAHLQHSAAAHFKATGDAIIQKGLTSRKIYLLDETKINQEEFDFIKRNKEKFFFVIKLKKQL